jgi:intracellular sulfur oxidation DsrE/DsrF family protein
MKKQIIISLFLFILTCSLYAQQPDYRVVFDMSTRDSVSQQALVREVELIRTYNPEAKIQVVVYGQGLNMVIKDRSKYTEAISKLLTDKNTKFKVCEFSLKRFEVDISKLIPGVEVVADGIYEIILKQREGWGYIKVAH